VIKLRVCVKVYVEAVWDCGHSPWECAKIPTPEEMEEILRMLEKELPKPKRSGYDRLEVLVTDGFNSDKYYVDYPANIYWARRVRKALERIMRGEAEAIVIVVQ